MENLKKLRMRLGLSQQALAEKFNLTQQSIYKYENGLAEPDIETLRQFAIFFGISVDSLINDTSSSAANDMLLSLSPTEREIKLLQNFRVLPPDVQDSIELIVGELRK